MGNKLDKSELKKNITIFYLVNFLTACIFTISVWSFFFTSYLNFSFSTALNLIIFSGITVFIFEIPSGAWADRFGRKKMYLIGLLSIIISFSIRIFAVNIFFFIIAAFLNGFGFAITSGNIEAIIHDELEKNNKKDEFNTIQANAYIWLFIGRSVSSLFAGYLFIINPLFPVYGTIISYIIALILVIFITDKSQTLAKNNSTKLHIKKSFTFLYKNKFLLHFIIILALLSAVGNIYWYTYQPYFKSIGISIKGIGLLFAITGLFSSLGAYLIKKIQRNFTEIQILHLMNILLFISGILFLQFNRIFALFGLIVMSIMFGFVMSFGNTILMKQSPNTYKSTILSIFSFAVTIGYTSFSFFSGYIVDYLGLKVLYFGNIIVMIFLIFYSFMILTKTRGKNY